MKKAFFVILTSIALVSCVKEGPRGPRGQQGVPGIPGKDGTQINTYYFEVFPNQWKSYGDWGSPGYYCYAEKTLPELSPSVIEEGAVLVYVLFDGYDHQLPYIIPSYDYNYDYGYYSTIIRYDLQAGKIGFIVEDSDFETPLPPYGNGSVLFKVVIISKI